MARRHAARADRAEVLTDEEQKSRRQAVEEQHWREMLMANLDF